MRQLATKLTTIYRNTRNRRRPMMVESLEGRRMLAAVRDNSFEIIHTTDGEVDYTCNSLDCPVFDMGTIPVGEVGSATFTAINTGSEIARKVDSDLNGTQVPGNFSRNTDTCDGLRGFLPNEACGFRIIFAPSTSDTGGSTYGGDTTLVEYTIDAFQAPADARLNMSFAFSTLSASEPPTADAGLSQSGQEDELITFDASGSSDPEGDSLTYIWDFGDGQTVETSDPTVAHAYAFGGTFDVLLTVDDGNGNQSTDTTTATVMEVNDVPVANSGGPYTGFENAAVTFDASSSFDFDNLDGTMANDQPLEYTWDFGDGTVVTTSAVTIDHTYTAADIYNVTLTVSDGMSSSAIAQTTANIDAPPPANSNDIYVWDISFSQKNRGPNVDHFIVVDVNQDLNADGIATINDASAAGVLVTVELRDSGGSLVGTYSGITNDNGIFTSDKIRNVPTGSYTAEVIDLAHATLQWNHLLDPTFNDEDADGDGLPDDSFVV